jgi:hypothetical protein
MENETYAGQRLDWGFIKFDIVDIDMVCQFAWKWMRGRVLGGYCQRRGASMLFEGEAQEAPPTVHPPLTQLGIARRHRSAILSPSSFARPSSSKTAISTPGECAMAQRRPESMPQDDVDHPCAKKRSASGPRGWMGAYRVG